MNTIRTALFNACVFLKKHLAARIALGVLAVFLVLWLVLHPQGTKTFLVLGMDNYGSLDEVGRSDVMMLVQVDFTRAKLTAATFARDMFIENENHKLHKINTIVQKNGEDYFCDLIEQNFGVPIDGWFRVNFTSVIELVDAIGGAKVELTQAEVKYLSNMGLNVYDDHPLQEGLSHLNGAQALAYARCRKLDNDLGRGERQGKLISAMVRQTRHMTAAGVAGVFNSLRHAWRSSYSIGEQAKLLFQALWLRGADVEILGMPFPETWHYGSAGSTNGIVANLEENKLLLLEALGRAVPPAP